MFSRDFVNSAMRKPALPPVQNAKSLSLLRGSTSSVSRQPAANVKLIDEHDDDNDAYGRANQNFLP
jgi:hypothetical protein